jgi:PAS domain S-box-containing protein
MAVAVLEKQPLSRPGQLRRAAPFLLMTLIGIALTPFVPAAEDNVALLGAAVALLAAVTAAVAFLPWERMPGWVEVTPALGLLVVVALLHDDTSDKASIYEALALMPIFWIALYGTLRQLIVVVLAAIVIFLMPGLLGGNNLAESLWRSAFAIAFAGLVVLVMEVSHISDLRTSSDERLRTVVETMPEGLVVVDESGRTVMSNRAAHELLTSDSESAALIEPLSQVVSGEPIDEQEVEVQSPGRRDARWIGVSGKPLQDVDGHPAGGVAVFHDITERKRAEQYRAAQYQVSRALAQAFTLEEALERLLEALGSSLGWQLGIFWSVEVKPVMSRSIGRPVRTMRFDTLWSAPGLDSSRVEHTCSKLTFSSPIGLLGRVWEGAAPAWDLNLDGKHSERIKAVTSLGLTGSICFPVIARDRVLGVVEFFVHDLHEPQGNLAGVLASIGSQLGEFIERMRAEQEADRDKDAFFGLVSHELRTPLTSIIGYLDLVLQEDGGLDAETLHHIEVARRNSDRLLRLVGDLLLVAQVQTGRFSHETAPVNLGWIAEACVEAARPVARERGVSLTYTGTQDAELVGDADRLSQLFDNLISNAIKFTEAGEQIEVRVNSTGDRAICEVSNTGSYIPPDEGARLFERFFRGSNATEQVVQGAGLGLAIAKAIVEVHGGAIRYESHEGVGTTFHFWLPLTQVEDDLHLHPVSTRPDLEHGRKT